MITAPNLSRLDWLQHGFGQRSSDYPSFITTLRQVHSSLVVEAKGIGGDRIADGDALVTGPEGPLVGVRTADCVPILLADRRTHATAAIHAGWRGTAENIVAATVTDMAGRFGTVPADVVAAVGPSIGACCYEVGPEVVHRFETWMPDMEQTQEPRKVNLRAINELQLRNVGVADIWVSADCTFCSPGYYSFRRERDEAGRMLSFVGRKNMGRSMPSGA
jgi:YfiH family protein